MRHHCILAAACAVQALTPPTTPTTPVVLEPPPPLEILYKGDAFAIVAKPGGVPSHARGVHGKDYVVPLLQRARAATGMREFGAPPDRGASGVLRRLRGPGGCGGSDDRDGRSLAAGQKTYVALTGKASCGDIRKPRGYVSTGDIKRQAVCGDRPIETDGDGEQRGGAFKFVASTGSEDAARASLARRGPPGEVAPDPPPFEQPSRTHPRR